jgi:hypothetical protein
MGSLNVLAHASDTRRLVYTCGVTRFAQLWAFVRD